MRERRRKIVIRENEDEKLSAEEVRERERESVCARVWKKETALRDEILRL